MPTSEEELAKRTREGWPETQGSPGEASGAAARDTHFKGRTDGQVHRTPLRGEAEVPLCFLPPQRRPRISGRTPRVDISKASLSISHVIPHVLCPPAQPVPPKASVEHGPRGSGVGGSLSAGRMLRPLSEATPTKTARDRQHLATTGEKKATEQAGQEERAVGLDWNKIGTSSQVVMVTILSSSTQRHDRASDEGIVSLREATQGCSGVVRTGPSLQRTSQG